jgi:hypothetical protein
MSQGVWIGLVSVAVVHTIVMMLVGGWVSEEKNREAKEGILLGIFFSLPGLILAALLPTKVKAKPKQTA